MVATARARGPVRTTVPLSATSLDSRRPTTIHIADPLIPHAVDPSLAERASRLRQTEGAPAGPWTLLAPAGGGRTTGLNYLAAVARASGYRVCSTHWTGSAGVPFHLIYDLVTHALTTATAPRTHGRRGSTTSAVDGWRAEEVTALQAVLECILAPDPEPHLQHDAVRDALHAVVEIWTRSAPTMVAVDDLHRADVASSAVLVDLLPRIADLPVLVVLAVRSEDLMTNSATAETFARICQGPIVERIRLAPLTVDQVGALAADRWNLRVEPMLARRLHAETSGNPATLTTVLDRLATQNRVAAVDGHAAVPDLAGGLTLPTTHAALAPIREQGATTWRVASVAASMPDLTLRQLRSLALGAGVETAVAGRVVDWLTAVGVMHREGSLRFASPVVRNTLRAQLGPHARTEVARIGQFDARSQIGEDDGGAQSTVRAQRYGTGIDRYATVDGVGTDDSETIAALRALHRQADWNGLVVLAERLLGGDPNAPIAAAAAGMLVRAHVARDASDDALLALDHWRSHPPLSPSNTAVHQAMTLLYRAELAAAREALRGADPDEDVTWADARISAAEGIVDATADGVVDGSASEPDIEGGAPITAAEIWTADALHDEVTAAFRAGRWDDVLHAARRDRADRDLARDPVGGGRITSCAAQVLVYRGHYRRARLWLDETAPTGPVGATRNLVRAELEFTVGRHGDATAILDRAVDFAARTGWHAEDDLIHAARVDAALSAGDTDGARGALTDLAAVRDRRPDPRSALLTDMAIALVTGDRRAAVRAASAAETCGELGLRARCSLAAGSVGESPTLRLTEAHDLFRELRAEPWCCRARAAMRRRSVSVPRDPDSVRGLGHTDRLLVSLVAEGLANRQIARVLSCSTKTVEGRLGRLFDATGRSSRTSLVAAYLAGELERERVPSTT